MRVERLVGLPLFNTAPSQMPVECAHSKERNFKEEWE